MASLHHTAPEPLVSIGLPTYNRAHMLRRAIASALDQTYTNIELLISDNASDDETEGLCRDVVRQDSRVQYFRHASNCGPTANFTSVLQRSSGVFFMWLADDDWIDPNYIAVCVGELVANPEFVAISGMTRFLDGESVQFEGEVMNLVDDSPTRRVKDFFQRVEYNSIYYSVMRRSVLQRIRYQNIFGNDWLLMGAMACGGKIGMKTTTYVNRSPRGISRNLEALVEGLHLPHSALQNTWVKVGLSALTDIALTNAGYRSLKRSARLRLGIEVADVIWSRTQMPQWWRYCRALGRRFAFLRSGRASNSSTPVE